MTRDDRRRLRAALRIHDELGDASRSSAAPLLPPPDGRDLERAARRLALADARGWSSAASVARADCRRLAAAATDRLADYGRALDRSARSARVQPPREVAADLAALADEFAEVAIELRGKTVSVTTDRVVLEGVDLGRFKIVLHWGRGGGLDYEVVALDPNPAGSDESVTHPHVRGESLCEGEGRVPIARALEDGRLYDLFLLVRGVLGTYNPGSAYVPLSRWEGAPCTDCGSTADAGDSCSCDRCGSDLCLDCGSGCADCGRTCCGDCRDRCAGCDETHCTACLRDCGSCGEPSCGGCMPGETCGPCRAAEDPEENPDDVPEPEPPREETDDDAHGLSDDPADRPATRDEAGGPAAAADPPRFAEAAGAAVHAVRLGEAAVPA